MNFSPEKLFLVGIIALVVLGPNRLPQAARTAGRLLAEFRRVSANMQNEFTQALAEPRDAVQKSIGEFGLTDVRSQLRATITEVVTGPAPTNGASRANGASRDGHVEPPIDPADGLAAEVGAPIVDPSRTLELNALQEALQNPAPSPASPPRGLPAVPDDPSFN